ncbi:helix-turn-helix domain-containing protein [Phytohabitans sp. ZYX-F-186]|uniref:Helix-turn-helix domain-containing protein n=1 Tax=Phytohabitans maris TaxID=3071409 RepID=A0ABU0ZT10_9ACTN|nr:helix-turn-helix domain-containing protein [Phytohabitans sp. ZYX-F-186]MDQ7910168.1 helix-turn-helix domain-containing protein [Phytohabitans sp. ZYX-F-186]
MAEISEENRALRSLVAIYRQLSGLAAQDADLGTVTQLVAERAAATAVVISQKMGILAAAAPGESYPETARYAQDNLIHPRLTPALAEAASTRRVVRAPHPADRRALMVAPVVVGEQVTAYLLVLVPEGDGRGEELTEHAATICGVILGRDRVVAAAASEVRDDLVEGVLSGSARSEEETNRWAQHLGYDRDVDHRAVFVALAGPPGDTEQGRALVQRAAVATGRFFGAQAPGSIISVRDAEVVAVLAEPGGPAPSSPGRRSPDPATPPGSPGRRPPAPSPAGPAVRERSEGRASQLGGMCVQRIGALFPGVAVTVGVGGVCRQPVQIAGSYEEARRTAEATQRLGRHGAVVVFDELGVRRLLFQVPDVGQLRRFAREVLGGLGEEYLTTLRTYFRENNSPQRASRILHVHPNTVNYRIRRVAELTGHDLDSYRDRLAMQVALEILEALGDLP